MLKVNNNLGDIIIWISWQVLALWLQHVMFNGKNEHLAWTARTWRGCSIALCATFFNFENKIDKSEARYHHCMNRLENANLGRHKRCILHCSWPDQSHAFQLFRTLQSNVVWSGQWGTLEDDDCSGRGKSIGWRSETKTKFFFSSPCGRSLSKRKK